jgi:hypothetical protein
MTVEDKVNEAITNHISALYDIDVLKSKYDSEVLQIVNDIAEYATNVVLLISDNDLLNHKETKERLGVKYPFLTEASKIKIADVAAYFWK